MSNTPKSSLARWAFFLSGTASLLALISCGLRSNALLFACVAAAVVAVGLAFAAWRNGGLRWWESAFLVAAPSFCMFLISAFDKVALAAARMQASNNAKQIALAMDGVQQTSRSLPAFAITSPNGTPLLSWRLAIYPYLESSPLYNQFTRNEPWDSPANLPLMKPMPGIFQSAPFDTETTSTPWQVFVGPGTAFEPEKKISLKSDFPDGLANTILFVEAADLVPWTKPQDLPYHPDAPLPKLGRVYANRDPLPWSAPHQPTGFFAAMADGSVRYVNAKVIDEVLRRVIVRNDGKPVADNWDQ
jgi:hypothetical protein